MVRFAATITLMASVADVTEAQSIVISRGGSHPVRASAGGELYGHARVEMLFEAVDPSHASAGSVTFEAGARTAWHSHPRGQILIITAGVGRVQRWGAPTEAVRAGRRRQNPSRRKHWHGASPQASLTHIGITEHGDGSTVQWMEKVNDEQYSGSPASQHAASSAGQVPASRLQSTGVDQAHQPAPAVGASAAKNRARTCDAHRRSAVRRCVAALGVVATRSQPRNGLGLDRDGKVGAACWSSGPSAQQRRAAQRGLCPSGAHGDLLRLAERRLGP